jgi:small subunit ribosomal protein S10
MPTATATKPKVKKSTSKVAASSASAKAAADKKAPRASRAKVAIKKEEPSVEHKLRIRVRAYEHKILDMSVKQIMDTAARFDAVVVGPVPLPTEIKRWTVNRSTFVHKDAREQFEMRVHKRLVDIMNPSPKVVEALTNLNLPSGVTIDVKMV